MGNRPNAGGRPTGHLSPTRRRSTVVPEYSSAGRRTQTRLGCVVAVVQVVIQSSETSFCMSISFSLLGSEAGFASSAAAAPAPVWAPVVGST